jgi:hypothetical protein
MSWRLVLSRGLKENYNFPDNSLTPNNNNHSNYIYNRNNYGERGTHQLLQLQAQTMQASESYAYLMFTFIIIIIINI